MYRFDLLQLGFFFSTYEKDFFFFSFGKQGLIIVKYRLERIRRFSFCLINLIELIKCGIYFKRFLFKINIINILDRGFQESSILEIQYNIYKNCYYISQLLYNISVSWNDFTIIIDKQRNQLPPLYISLYSRSTMGDATKGR